MTTWNPTSAQRSSLLQIARQAIECGLASGQLGRFPNLSHVESLSEPRASFVTLRQGVELRGCCGSIDAQLPLAKDVWRAAWSAAFADPRFPRLQCAEWPQVNLHISVLNTPEQLNVTNEAELLGVLQPRIDGLILQLGASRATFLPAVWEQLPDPEQFVRQLKIKAGWRADFWSPQIRACRYTAASFGEHPTEGS